MDYHHQELFEGDPLALVHFIAFEIFENIFSKIIVASLLMIHVIISLAQTYYFFYVLNREEIVNYAPVFCSGCYIILSCYLILTKNNILEKVKAIGTLWSFKTCGRQFENQLYREAKIISAYTILCSILAAVGSFYFMVPLSDDSKIFLCYRIFKDVSPRYSLILEIVYRFFFFPSACVMIAHSLQIVYCCSFGIFQGQMMLKFVQCLTNDFDDEGTLLEDDYYQQEMHFRLCFCINNHVAVLRWVKYALDVLRPLMFPFVCIGILCGIAVVFFLFGFQGEVNFHEFIRATIFATAFCLLLVGLTMAGQTVESVSEEGIIILMNANWYTWNERNKKTYLIFTANATQIIQLKATNGLALNYEGGLRVIKLLYSLISVFSNTKNIISNN